jgi:hypothetical protein
MSTPSADVEATLPPRKLFYFNGVMDEETRPLLEHLIQELNDGEGILVIFRTPKHWNKTSILETTVHGISGHDWNYISAPADEWEATDDDPMQFLVSSLHVATTLNRVPTRVFSQGKAKIKATDEHGVSFGILGKNPGKVTSIRAIVHQALNMGLNGDLLLHEWDVIGSVLKEHDVFHEVDVDDSKRERPICFETYGAGGAAREDIVPGMMVVSDGVIDIRTHVDPRCIIEYLDERLPVGTTSVRFQTFLEPYKAIRQKILESFPDDLDYSGMEMVHDVSKLVRLAADCLGCHQNVLMRDMPAENKRYYGEIAYSTAVSASKGIYRIMSDQEGEPFVGDAGHLQALDLVRTAFRQMGSRHKSNIVQQIIEGKAEVLFPGDQPLDPIDFRLSSYADHIQETVDPAEVVTDRVDLTEYVEQRRVADDEIEQLQQEQIALVDTMMRDEASDDDRELLQDVERSLKVLEHDPAFHLSPYADDESKSSSGDVEALASPFLGSQKEQNEKLSLLEENLALKQAIRQAIVNRQLEEPLQWPLLALTAGIEPLDYKNHYFFDPTADTLIYVNGVGTLFNLNDPEGEILELFHSKQQGVNSYAALSIADRALICLIDGTHKPDLAFAETYHAIEKQLEEKRAKRESVEECYLSALQRQTVFEGLANADFKLLKVIAESIARTAGAARTEAFSLTCSGNLFFVGADKDAAASYGVKLVEMENHLFNEIVFDTIARLELHVARVHVTKIAADPRKIEDEIVAALDAYAATATMTLDDYVAAYQWVMEGQKFEGDAVPECGRWREAEAVSFDYPGRFYSYSRNPHDIRVLNPFWKEIGTDLLREISDGSAFRHRATPHVEGTEADLKQRALDIIGQGGSRVDEVRALFQSYLLYMDFGLTEGLFKVYTRLAPGYLHEIEDWDQPLYKANNTAICAIEAVRFIADTEAGYDVSAHGLWTRREQPTLEEPSFIDKARGVLQRLNQKSTLDPSMQETVNLLITEASALPELSDDERRVLTRIDKLVAVLEQKNDVVDLLDTYIQYLKDETISSQLIQGFEDYLTKVRDAARCTDLLTRCVELKNYVKDAVMEFSLKDPRSETTLGCLMIALEYLVRGLIFLISFGCVTYKSSTTKQLNRYGMFNASKELLVDELELLTPDAELELDSAPPPAPFFARAPSVN